MHKSSIAVALLASSFIACGSSDKSTSSDSGTQADGQSSQDSGAVDAGGGSDAATTDANNADAFVPDPNTGIRGWVVSAGGVHDAIAGATVRVGTYEATTDERGLFSLTGLPPGDNLIITVTPSEPNYAPYVHTFNLQEHSIVPFAVELAPMIGTTFDAADGVVFTSFATSKPASVTIPPNGVAYEDGRAATGTISIHAISYDVTTQDSYGSYIGWDTIPGDMSGVDADGNDVELVSYGMVTVELYDSAGVKLNLASGVHATLTWDIDTNFFADEPSTLPMWWFDPTTAKWREEGSAMLDGETYTAQVSHFSTWNADRAFDPVTVYGRLLWAGGALVTTPAIVGVGGVGFGFFSFAPVNRGNFSFSLVPGYATTVAFGVMWNGFALFHQVPNIGPDTSEGFMRNRGDITLPWPPPPPTLPHCIDFSTLPDREYPAGDNVVGVNLAFAAEFGAYDSGYESYSDIAIQHVAGGWRLAGAPYGRVGNPAIQNFGVAESTEAYDDVTTVNPAAFTWLNAYQTIDVDGSADVVVFTRDGSAWAAQATVSGGSTMLCYRRVIARW